MIHKPVLLKEVLEIFDPQPGETYIDATVNGGGHALAIAERVGPKGEVAGIDWDCQLPEKLKIKSEKLKVKNLILVCDNYANIKSIAGKYNLGKIAGILFDLGFSSYHIEESGRGFSFLRNEPLDMRYSPKNNELTAEKIINTWPEEAIETILREYGEERFAHRISRGIIQARHDKNISTTAELVKIISRSVPQFYLKSRLHPATKTFQALRMAVNDELGNLERALEDAVYILGARGKIAVISFHSLEDRIFKNFFKERSREGSIKILTPKPVGPEKKEIYENPRARSAKLRVATKT